MLIKIQGDFMEKSILDEKNRLNFFPTYTMITVTTVAILIVAYQTVLHVRKKEICVEE